MSASRFHLSERKIIRRSRSKTFQPFVSSTLNITLPQSHVAVMSTSTEKLSSFPENADVEKRNSLSGTKMKEKGEMQKDEKENLQCILAGELYPEDLRSWPIFSLLEPEFIPQIHTVVVYGNLGNRAIIVTKDKNVFNLGYDKNDCSTTGDKRAFCLKKIEELCGKNIKTFAYNYNFILALTEEGEVYYWEFIKSGVEGFRPTRVAGLSEKRIVDIACGSNHSLALTSDGKVYAWGENNFGQVGNENTAIFNGNVPRQVKHELEKKNVIHIACGLSFNMVITDENKLYAWGNNESDQILYNNKTSFSFTTLGGSSTDHRTLNCTNSFPYKSNSKNSIFVNSSNSTNAFGYNATSNSVQSQNHYVYPREITVISDKIVKVACGYDHTLALTDKGKVFAWGKNHVGQLGGIYNIQSVMVNMSQLVLDIAAYGNLSVAEGSDRIIYVWGDYFGQYITTPFRTTFSRIHEPFAYNSCRVMHKPLTVSTNVYEHAKEVLKIVESLGTGFDDPSTSDFTIQVEGQSIHVHKVILKRRCQYFKKMFERDWTENDQNMLDSSVHTVSDKFSYIVYKAFLKYLYTGKIDLPAEKTLELMKLADSYRETNLKKNCSQIIKQTITVSNVAFFYNKAIEYDAKELEESCLQFAFRQLTAVVESEDFAKLDVNVMLNFIRKAANGNVFKT